MLFVEDLIKRYEQKEIGPFSFKVDTNETLIIIGKSGSGKSTLVKMITGVVKSDFGVVSFNNANLSKEDFTYISQIGTLFNHLTILENLRLTFKGDMKNIIQVLEEVNLKKDYLERYPFELSGGERQRIDLARAIISKTKIMILDEAFSALDISTKDDIYEVLRHLRKAHDLLIIVITHDVEEALNLGDKIMILDDGNMLFNAESDKILTSIDNSGIDNLISDKRLDRLRKVYLDV